MVRVIRSLVQPFVQLHPANVKRPVFAGFLYFRLRLCESQQLRKRGRRLMISKRHGVRTYCGSGHRPALEFGLFLRSRGARLGAVQP